MSSKNQSVGNQARRIRLPWNKSVWLGALFGLAGFQIHAEAQAEPKLLDKNGVKVSGEAGKGLTVEVGSRFSLNIRSRFQIRYQSNIAAPEAFEVSQHVVMMGEGRVLQAGSPTEVYDHPSSPAVATFLGANLLRGHIKEGRADMGVLSVDAPGDAREGAAAMAFVRSHDVQITRPVDPPAQFSPARIVRAKRVGGFTKVVIEMPAGDQVTLDLPHVDFDKLGVKSGDNVLVNVRAANIFVVDYEI